MNRLLLPALCAAALAAVIALEVMTGDPPPQPMQAGPAAPAATPGSPQPDPAPGQIAALLARPPFAPDRKPDATLGSGDPRLPHLTGIVVTRDSRKAIFSTADGGRGVVIGQGDQIGAYRVQQIEAMDVILLGSDGPHTVRPTFAAPTPGLAQSPALPFTGASPLQLPPPPILARVAVPPIVNVPAVPGSGNPR